MNFFRSKDPDISEISREKRVKESLISELSACLKNIQTTQQSRRAGEPIYTCDSSNQLCNVLEAVFLHGHKSTQGARKSQTTDNKSFDRCSFWSFVQRFTHKDTISQLKRLAHIKTETGVCRAWVKLAINDGLVESYITAMLAQPNVLRQYYTRTAMLRDLEQPEILLKLIQVLSAANYDFQLVYNSSQLNVWGMKTLGLTGLVERQFLFDAGNNHQTFQASANHTPEPRSRTSTLDMDDFPNNLLSISHNNGQRSSPLPSVSSSDRLSNSQAGSFSQTDEVFGEAVDSIKSSHHEEKKIDVVVEQASSSNIPQSSTNQSDNEESQVPANTPHDGIIVTRQLSRTHIHDALKTLGEDEDESDSLLPTSVSADSVVSSGSGAGVDNSTISTKKVNQAERELARLRNAHYSINDIINTMDNSVEEDPAPDEVSQILLADPSPVRGININETIEGSPPPSVGGPAANTSQPFSAYSLYDPPNTASHTGTSLTQGSAAVPTKVERSVRLNSYDEEPYGSPHVLGQFPEEPYASTDMLSDSSQAARSEGADATSPDWSVLGAAERTVQTDRCDVPSYGEVTASFVVGTPQSDFLSSHEQAAAGSDQDEEEEEEDSPYSRGEKIPEKQRSSSDGQSSQALPLSAARAIMSKRLTASDTNRMIAGVGCQVSSVGRAVHGNSLGGMSHGNSISSLVGWGAVDQEDGVTTQSEPKTIQKVQSYADMVSEQSSQADDLTFGSPNYPTNGSLKDTTIVEENSMENSSEKKNTDSGNEDKQNEDDFELVGDVDKDDCADILAHYGELCSELGLDLQDYKCYSCSAPVGIIYGAPRVCSYTKRYYCTECHVNEDCYVPAKIIYNWDFAKYKVSKASRDFLTSAESMPLIDVQLLNIRLYDHIPELEKCKVLRTQLFYLKRYLFACNTVIADELKQKFWPKEYLYEEVHTYSIQDFLMINTSTTLANQMRKAIKFARAHVVDCESCKYRGFLCEICSDAEVIFPFDLDTTSRCGKCNAVYHKACFTSDCPKCERIKRRDQLLAGTSREAAVGIDDVY